MAFDPQLREALVNDLPPDFSADDPWSNHFVLGRRLRPFCLWHLALLQAIDSPLIEASRPSTPQDLDRAVSICRTRYMQVNLRARSTARLFFRIAAGGFPRAIEAFAAFLKDFDAAPVTRPAPSPHKDTSAPEMPIGRPEHVFTRACTVIEWAKCQPAVAWEMPIGMAGWYESRAIETAGLRLDYEDDDRRKFEAGMKARIDAKRKAKAARKAKEQQEQSNGNGK